jgi:hypothetical protein
MKSQATGDLPVGSTPIGCATPPPANPEFPQESPHQPQLALADDLEIRPQSSPEIEHCADDHDDDRGYCFTCNNTGFVNCYCGGDLCVCHNHGEKPCRACDS